MTLQEDIEFAREWFREAHASIGQKRHYTGEPYHNHTEAVEYEYAQIFPLDRIGRIGALGHDFKEDVLTHKDCPARYDKDSISRVFGKDVDEVITALTDIFTSKAFPDWNREKRKSAEARRLGAYYSTVHAEKIHTLKALDLHNNTSGSGSIVTYDIKFARVYLPEKERVLRYLTKAHRIALGKAWSSLNWGFEKLAEHEQHYP